MAGEEAIYPWHGSRFDVKTGSVLTPPARQGVKSFPVRIAGNDVEVDIRIGTGGSSDRILNLNGSGNLA